MNNRKKAIVSAVAGAALLAGTATTFALWQDTAALGAESDAASIAIGHLLLDGQWAPEFVPADDNPDLWAPGLDGTWTMEIDSAEFVQLAGDNLTAELTLVFDDGVASSIVDGGTTVFHFGGAHNYWELTAAVDGRDAVVDEDGVVSFGTFDANAETEFDAITITVTLEFISGNEHRQGVGETADVFDFEGSFGQFYLTQVTPEAAPTAP